MSTHLLVAGTDWTLTGDVDVATLKAQIYGAIHTAGTGMGNWVTTTVDDGGIPVPLELYLSPGIAIAITTDSEYDVSASTY